MTPTQFNIEAEGAASQIEQKIDEILLDLATRNWKTERDEHGFDVLIDVPEAVEAASKAILQLITEARLDEANILRHRTVLNKDWPQYYEFSRSDMDKFITTRIEELRKEIQ